MLLIGYYPKWKSFDLKVTFSNMETECSSLITGWSSKALPVDTDELKSHYVTGEVKLI